MLRNQDVSIPFGDSRRLEFDLDLSESEDDGIDSPVNLLGKHVTWEVRRSPGSEPLLSLDDADPQLRIEDAENGFVTVKLTSRETTIGLDGARHSLRVTDGSDSWTCATGNYTIIR